MNPSHSIAQHIAKNENLAIQLKESDETKQTITNPTPHVLDEEASLTSYEETETILGTLNVNVKKKYRKKRKDIHVTIVKIMDILPTSGKNRRNRSKTLEKVKPYQSIQEGNYICCRNQYDL
ncbi:hypothetical protein HHI36_000649 [Cryptolaemus montrouzieri]|uniref:Uncharacterized protein n=1 Tax=Cryptolaemus montrouzieri TaxID=559131 RepID=A0ABD2P604_9CUCU